MSRKLDALVGRHIEQLPITGTLIGVYYERPGGERRKVSRYSTDMNAALRALETAGWRVARGEWIYGSWVWWIVITAGGKQRNGTHENCATALCIALLRAAGVTEPEITAALEKEND